MEENLQHHSPDDYGLLLLLDVVSKNASIRKITRSGIRFKEIFKLTKSAIESGFIINESGKLTLTEKGRELIELNKGHFKPRNKNDWIDLQRNAKIAKLSKNAIFVPQQDELTFLL